MPDETLEQLKPDLDRCNKCGFCMAGCPTYLVGGRVEWLVTRGRVSIVQDALNGDVPLEEMAPAVDTCLLCRACMDHCPPKVPIDYLMTRARSAMRREKPLPRLARFILRGVLPRPRLLRAAARAGALGEKLGLRKLAAPFLKPWPTLDRANRVGPSLPGVSARGLLDGVPLKPEGPVLARVAYLISCTRDTVFPYAARAAVRVLVAAGCEVVLPEVPCCGLPCHSLGDLEGAHHLEEQNKQVLNNLQVDAIISDEGSCAAHLAGFLPVKDFATFLAELGLPEAKQPVNKVVTWHDPCHLKHFMGVWSAPRQLIRGVPGITYQEAVQADVCCGGAGAFMLTQADLSDKILDLKAKAFATTEADLVVTSSPSCLIQLGRAMNVISLAELLEQAYCTKEETSR